MCLMSTVSTSTASGSSCLSWVDLCLGRVCCPRIAFLALCQLVLSLAMSCHLLRVVSQVGQLRMACIVTWSSPFWNMSAVSSPLVQPVLAMRLSNVAM